MHLSRNQTLHLLLRGHTRHPHLEVIEIFCARQSLRSNRDAWTFCKPACAFTTTSRSLYESFVVLLETFSVFIQFFTASPPYSSPFELSLHKGRRECKYSDVNRLYYKTLKYRIHTQTNPLNLSLANDLNHHASHAGSITVRIHANTRFSKIAEGCNTSQLQRTLRLHTAEIDVNELR